MRPTRQIELIRRIKVHQDARRGTDAADRTMAVSPTIYTATERLEAERRMLARVPTVAGLSGMVPEAGSYATIDVGGRSVILTRDSGGAVHAVLNACRHRGAELKDDCGSARKLVCPYHGWSYALDGAPLHRRRDEHFADTPAVPLITLPALEADGLIWVSADPEGEIPAQPLSGAEEELAPFDLGGYELFARTEFTRQLNWKLAVDTFCEAYHVGILHRRTIAQLIHSDFSLFDAMGFNGRLIAVRKSIDALPNEPDDSWELLPHATILYILVPNAVLVHQQDHVELFQSRPGANPAEAHLTVSLYVPSGNSRSDNYWRKNFDLLVSVTDTEDFTTAAGMQRAFDSGGLPHVVFGRNEPALQHYHRGLEALLDGSA